MRSTGVLAGALLICELGCAGPLAGLLKSEPAEAEPVADGPAAQSKQGKAGQETKKTS